MRRKIVFLGIIVSLFIFSSACAPGALNEDPAAQYYPTYTAIAQGLLDLASTATARAGGEQLATATQVPTLPSTATNQPMATGTPVPEPSFTLVPESGTANSLDEGGSTRYEDYDARFKIVIPAGWLSVRLNSEEFYAALGDEAANDQQLMRAMTTSQNYDPNVLRLVAYDIKPEHRETDFMTNMNITWDTTISDPLDKILADTPVAMKQSIAGINILSTELIALGEGNIPAGSIKAQWQAKTFAGAVVDMIQEIVFFSVPQGTVFITLTTSLPSRDRVEPDFDAMIQTLELFEK